MYFFRNLLCTLLFLAVFTLQAQPGNPPIKGFPQQATGRIYGKILEKSNGKAMEYVSVTAHSIPKDSLLGGALTDDNGEFSIEKIPLGKLKVRIRFMGYETVEKDIVLSFDNMDQDLGNIRMSSDAKQLDEVVIEQQKSTFTMNIDRKVYNVGTDISVQGGTAVDVLKNVPSVSVDGEGNATLRNNSVQIYIDGKPSTLTLQQIPADQIERIEVITNPSVKFEAAATGGILNVVLKKNTKPGYNGMITAGGGNNGRYNTMANLNIKQAPWNFSLTYSINGRSNLYNNSSERINYQGGEVLNYFNQYNSSFASNYFQFGKIGVDYQINNRSSISFSENISANRFMNNDRQDFYLLGSSNEIKQQGDRTNYTIYLGNNFTSELSFRHNFPKKGKELTAFVNHNYSYGDRDYTFSYSTYDSVGQILPDQPQIQKNDGTTYTNQYVMQVDFSNPIGTKTKIEMGLRSFMKFNDQSNFTTNLDYSANAYVKDTILSNNYDIREVVNAAYFNYITSFNKWGFQAGMRFEQSYFKAKIADRAQEFSYSYPADLESLKGSLFPGVYLTRKMDDKKELQFNVSRKINRPNWWQMNPFIMSADQQNIRIGNPSIRPEFINLAELNYSQYFKKSNLLTSLYFRHTENPISSTAYASPDDPLVLINTFVNGTNSFAYGLDNTYKFSPLKKMDLLLNANVFYYQINTTNTSYGSGTGGITLTSKANLTYTLPKDYKLQVNGNYESPRYILNGKMMPVWSIDISASKTISKQWSVTASVNDIFNKRRWGTILETDDYYQSSYRRWDIRSFRINITYMFGKQDAMIWKPRKRSDDNNSDGGGMGY